MDNYYWVRCGGNWMPCRQFPDERFPIASDPGYPIFPINPPRQVTMTPKQYLLDSYNVDTSNGLEVYPLNGIDYPFRLDELEARGLYEILKEKFDVQHPSDSDSPRSEAQGSLEDHWCETHPHEGSS